MLLCGGCVFSGCRFASDAPTTGAMGCCFLCMACFIAGILAVVHVYADPNGGCVESHFGGTKLLYTAKTWWWFVVVSGSLQLMAGLFFCTLWVTEPEMPPPRRSSLRAVAVEE